MSLERLLFASIHGYLDPSSGAALATRDLLELLAARGVDIWITQLDAFRLGRRERRLRPPGD